MRNDVFEVAFTLFCSISSEMPSEISLKSIQNHKKEEWVAQLDQDCIVRILNFLNRKLNEKHSDASFWAFNFLIIINTMISIFPKLEFSREMRDDLLSHLITASKLPVFNVSGNTVDYLINHGAPSVTLLGLIIDTHFGFSKTGNTDARNELEKKTGKLNLKTIGSIQARHLTLEDDTSDVVEMNPHGFVAQLKKKYSKEVDNVQYREPGRLEWLDLI